MQPLSSSLNAQLEVSPTGRLQPPHINTMGMGPAPACHSACCCSAQPPPGSSSDSELSSSEHGPIVSRPPAAALGPDIAFE